MTTTALLVPVSAAAAAPGVAPKTFAELLHPGESTTITKTVTTPEILPKPDVYFLADTTGSMTPAIENVKANASSILSQIDAAANDPQYGAGQYRDFVSSSFAYQNDASIGTSSLGVVGAIGAWTADEGGDLPEANLFALQKLIGAAGFRADSSKIVVWFGDAPGHDPVCTAVSGEPDVTEASVTAALQAAGIKVIAVSVTTGADGGLNGDPAAFSFDYGACAVGGTPGQADRIAAATGGQSFTDVAPEEVATKILQGLTALPVTVTPSATCDPGLSATFDPAEQTVTSGGTAVFQETLTVAADADGGTATCTVQFLLNGEPAGDEFTETNTITVNRPPDCAAATVSPAVLWPPNHKYHTVGVTVPDGDGDTVTTTITGVTQDEALDGAADGSTSPDAAWVTGHADQVQVRAERSGAGDGRVYRIAFTATDGTETCTGTVTVGVPHDQSGPAAVDTVAVVVNSFGS